MHNISDLVDLYKCLAEESESIKHYEWVIEKLEANNKTDIASVLKKMCMQKKGYIQDLSKLIKEYIKIEYKNSEDIQQLIGSLNDIMIKTFID